MIDGYGILLDIHLSEAETILNDKYRVYFFQRRSGLHKHNGNLLKNIISNLSHLETAYNRI